MGKSAVLLLILILVSSTTVTFFPVHAVASVDDWPMFHRDPEHTGYTNSAGPKTTPIVLWSRTVETRVSSSPAVVDGIVYVSSDGLHAFNASTGVEIWALNTGGVGSPAVSGGYLYTGVNEGTAYNASTGELVWSAQELDLHLLWHCGWLLYIQFGVVCVLLTLLRELKFGNTTDRVLLRHLWR
jgi:outer membrane protein assembly factor BamB